MTTDLVRALAAAEAALADLSEVGGDWAVVEGIPCCRQPVHQPWAAQAKVMSPPATTALAAAMRWLTSRSGAGGRVTTRSEHADLPVFGSVGLRPIVVFAAMALAAPPEGLRPVSGLEVSLARSAEEFNEVFCVDAPDLAPLVTARHLTAPSYRYVVGRVDGVPVGCAAIRLAAGTAHLYAIGVLSAYRGRGIGTAVSAAASREAARLTAGPVWLHAEAQLHPMYGRLGYRIADEHVQLELASAQ